MTITVVTPQLVIERIDNLLQGKVSITEFGHEIIGFLAFEDEYELERGHKELLAEVLAEFMDMHDFGQEDLGYEPHIPSRERLIELREKLKMAVQ